MLHILLLIVKIIGIILGTLLAILLIGLMAALFVPVRYRIEASRTEEEGGPPIEAAVKITWLLHLINIRVQYPADVYVRARIFLFTVFRLPQAQKKADNGKGRRKKERGRNTETERKAETDSKVEAGSEAETDSNAEADSKAKSAGQVEQNRGETRIESAECTSETEDAASKRSQEPEPVSEPEKKKTSFIEKLKEKIEQILRIFQKIWYTLTGICDKIKAIWENIEYYMDILRSDTFQQAFSLCKEELFSIFSYIKPRKFQADLVIGMDDPAATGKILSYYGMLYPFIGEHINITPDFERKRIEGTVFIRGKIRLFTFVKAALRIYFNKDIRKLLKLFKKEDL